MDLTILVVEDDRDLRDTLAEYLTAEGYAVIAAASYDEAMGILPRAPVAAIVTDLKLACEPSGWDLARDAARLSPAPPVIAFTGREDVGAIQASGLFADVLLKENPALLADALRAVLGGR